MFYALRLWISELFFEIYVTLHSFADNFIEKVKGVTSALYQYFSPQQDHRREQNDNHNGAQNDNHNGAQDDNHNGAQNDNHNPARHSQNNFFIAQINPQNNRQLYLNNPVERKHQFKKISFVPRASLGRFIKGMIALIGFLFVAHVLQHNQRKKHNLKISAQPTHQPLYPEVISLPQIGDNHNTTEICLYQLPFDNISTIYSDQRNAPFLETISATHSQATKICTHNLMTRNRVLSFESAFPLCLSSVQAINTFGPHKDQLKKEATAACVEENTLIVKSASQFCPKAGYWAVKATNQLHNEMNNQGQSVRKALQFIGSQWAKAKKLYGKKRK